MVYKTGERNVHQGEKRLQVQEEQFYKHKIRGETRNRGAEEKMYRMYKKGIFTLINFVRAYHGIKHHHYIKSIVLIAFESCCMLNIYARIDAKP